MTHQIMPIQSINFLTLFIFLKLGLVEQKMLPAALLLKPVALLQAFYQFINTEDLIK